MCDRTKKLQRAFEAGKVPSGLLTFNKLPHEIAIQVSKILDTSLGQSPQSISFVSVGITTNKEEMNDIRERTRFRVWHEE
jgi:hypothetical protein